MVLFDQYPRTVVYPRSRPNAEICLRVLQEPLHPNFGIGVTNPAHGGLLKEPFSVIFCYLHSLEANNYLCMIRTLDPEPR